MFTQARLAARRVPTLARGMADAKKPKNPPAFNWLGDPGTYPVIMVIVGASALAAFKLGYDAIVKPETHFMKSTRGTVDYVENDYFPDRTELNQKHMDAYKASQKN